jgi:hypothetical protein
MTFWERISGWLAPLPPPQGNAVCVQQGELRAYIWPHDRQFSYEVVSTRGERLSVGADNSFDRARNHAVDVLRRLS